MEFLHLLCPFLAGGGGAAAGAWPDLGWLSWSEPSAPILVSLLSFFHPLVQPEEGGELLGAFMAAFSSCLCKLSTSPCNSRYFTFIPSISNLSELMSFFAAAQPSWNDCGVPSSSALLAGTAAAASPPATALLSLTCSEKRTWTTTRRGRRSFCAACMQASMESFWQSMTRQRRFLSCSERPGWALRYESTARYRPSSEDLAVSGSASASTWNLVGDRFLPPPQDQEQ